MECGNVCFHGPLRYRGDVLGSRRVNSLAADHQEFRFVQDGTGSPDRMLKRLSFHVSSLNER